MRTSPPPDLAEAVAEARAPLFRAMARQKLDPAEIGPMFDAYVDACTAAGARTPPHWRDWPHPANTPQAPRPAMEFDRDHERNTTP